MKTIFLDRDGVINRDIGYVSKWENFYFLSGVIEALQFFTKNKIEIIIITNQSGLARGLFTTNDYELLNCSFKNFCLNNKIKILDIYHCPHHPKGIIKEFSKNCNCRKPKPGLFLRAIKEHKVNINKSFMVGDKISDMEAARSAGIKNLFIIQTNNDLKDSLNYNIIRDLFEVTKLIQRFH